MPEQETNKHANLKKIGASTIGLMVFSFAALKLPKILDSLAHAEDTLPPDVTRLMQLTSRIDESGETINGSWIARKAEDQDWIDSAQFVHRFLTYPNKDLFTSPRSSLILAQQIENLRGAIKTVGNVSAREFLVSELEKLKNNPRQANPNLANSLESACEPYRYTDPEELSSLKAETEAKIENLTYFDLPSF